MNQLISKLRKYDEKIDATQVVDALWLSNVMSQGVRIDVQEDLGEEKENGAGSNKGEGLAGLPREVSHKVVIRAKKETKPKHNMGFEKSNHSSSSYAIEFSKKSQLPKIEKQFMALQSKQKSLSLKEIDEEKTADHIATTGFFYPIFKNEKLRKNYYGLSIVFDKSDSVFLWQEQIEHFIKSMRFSKLFTRVEIFEVDSSKVQAEFFHFYSKKSIESNAAIFKKEKTLTLVFSDLVGLAWKSRNMFEVLEQWTKTSFVSIVSMLPQQMWQRTSLRTGVKLFMNSKNCFPKNDELRAEFNFLERKLGEYVTRIPVIPFSSHSFEDLSALLMAKKDKWIDTRVYKKAMTNSSLLEKEKTNLEAKARVENFFASALPKTRLLAIYCSVLPLNEEIIKEVINIKELGKTVEAFAEFYFAELIYKNKDGALGTYDFYEGVRKELLIYISMEEAEVLFEKLKTLIISTLNVRFGLLELLYAQDEIKDLTKEEVALVNLLIEILGEKGSYYRNDIARISPMADVVFPKISTYQMGSKNGRDNEKPVHQITFDHNFEIAKTPVTFEEYDLYCEDTKTKKPSDEGWGRGKRPVINVSWDDAKAYCKWLSKKTNKEYRLPSEAEWEYACRAGTTTKWSFGDDEKALGKYAWYDKNSNSKTHEVREKLPNPWGLYDMHGNVREWCEDDWVNNYNATPKDGTAYIIERLGSKVVRGGSWNFIASYSRSAYRFNRSPYNRLNSRGFRLLRTLP